jgi:hypothetical protein
LPPDCQQLGSQIVWLLLLAIPIACVSWSITHEEITREPREWLQRHIDVSRSWWVRKFLYIFTCEYCFSHYVTIALLLLTRYRLLLDDWRGSVLAFFALVWVANVYMSAFQRLRVVIRSERAEAKLVEQEVEANGESNKGSRDR